MAHKYFYDHKKISLVFKFFLTYANLYILYTHNFLKEMNRRLHQKTIFFQNIHKSFMAENWPWKLPPFMRIYLHSLPVIMLYFFKKKFFLYFCSKNSAPTRPPRAPRPSQSSSLHWNCAENSNVNWSLSPPIQGPQIDSYIDWFLSTTIKMLWLLFIFQLYEGGKMIIFIIFREIKNNAATARPVSPSYREQWSSHIYQKLNAGCKWWG